MRLFLFILVVFLVGCSNQPTKANLYQVIELADADRDGVIDARDKCPQTSSEVIVDYQGCKQLERHTDNIQLAIEFKHGSGYLHPKFHDEIKVLAQRLDSNSRLNLLLEGHFSVTGGSAVNYKLSLRRARVIGDRLIKYHKVNPNRITVVGRGATLLKIHGDSDNFHHQNRRVTASLIQDVPQQKRYWQQ